MTKLLSRSLEEDVERGEVRVVGLAAFPTGVWAVAEVVSPTEQNDKFRTYPDENYSNNIGLICNCAPSREKVLDMARQWS